MADLDDRIKRLGEQCERKRKLRAVLDELFDRKRELSDKVFNLKMQMLHEQTDVDRLEGRSLYAFFYNVIGKKDEMLTKERAEAYEARVKYDAAMAEQQAVSDDIERFNSELESIKNCENEYRAALKEKAEKIKAAGIADSEKIIKLEQNINSARAILKEIDEAVSAGKRAKDIAESILESLDKAKNWSTYDLLGGNGIISHTMKHEHLDTAQSNVERLQVALRKFKTELTDVKITFDSQVNIDGFLKFADYFFDGLFVDLSVRSRITDSQQQVMSTMDQIKRVLYKLDSMKRDTECKLTEMKEKYDELIISAGYSL